MPYFKTDNVNILFIHIPKTGGTSVEFYFSSKFGIQLNNKALYLFMKDEELLNKNIIINSSLQHITYNQMVKYSKEFNIMFDDNIKIITIVRNPYQRIISDLFFYKLITLGTTSEEVFDIITKYLESNTTDNHNIPQYIFITDENKEVIKNIHILKTENLTNEMHDLGYTDFNLVLHENKNKVNYYNYLNNKSIEIINNFYHLDFILFNYDKISV
jgi:hypothetical protein